MQQGLQCWRSRRTLRQICIAGLGYDPIYGAEPNLALVNFWRRPYS